MVITANTFPKWIRHLQLCLFPVEFLYIFYGNVSFELLYYALLIILVSIEALLLRHIKRLYLLYASL